MRIGILSRGPGLDSRLRDRDLQVLSVSRGSVTIPTPKRDVEIAPGDVHLCFGKSLTLKSLAPRTPLPKRRGEKPGGPPSAPDTRA